MAEGDVVRKSDSPEKVWIFPEYRTWYPIEFKNIKDHLNPVLYVRGDLYRQALDKAEYLQKENSRMWSGFHEEEHP